MSNARIRRDLPNDEYQAAVGANNPSASNVFATINDLPVITGEADSLIFDAKYDEAGGIVKGQAVYVSGADGTNILVKKADYSTEATSSKTLGLVTESGALNHQGRVISDGLLSNIDTSGAGAVGDPVWLGDDGNLIYGLINKPYAPNHLVFIGIVTKKNASTGEIFVKVQNGFELDEIHNVDLKSTLPVTGDALVFDGTLWVPGATYGKFGIANSLGKYTYYADLTTAITAAVSGETIEFFSDYNETGAVSVALKSGVNINMNGHTYTLSHSAAAVNAFTGSNIQMSFLNGNIVIDTATFSSIGLSVGGSNTDIDCTGLYIKVISSGGTGRPLAASGGVIRNLRALSIDDLCASASRTTLFNCNLRATGTGNGLSLGLSTLGNVGNAYDCYIQSNSGVGAVVNVNSLCVNCNIVSTSGIGLSLLGGTIRGGSILTGANYAVSSNTEYSSGLHTGTAISNATIISTSTAVLMTAISTANNIIRNCVISGGTNAVEISGTSLASNNYILSCTLSGSAGSNCIYSATLNTPCAYANNVYQTTTTPVSANITADIVNTQDNQGNILV